MQLALRIVSLLAPLRGRPPREPHQCLGSCQGSCQIRRRRLRRYSRCLLYLRYTCRRLTLGAFSKDPRLGTARRDPGLPKQWLLVEWLWHACDAHMKVFITFWYSARATSGLCAGKCSQAWAYSNCRCTHVRMILESCRWFLQMSF